MCESRRCIKMTDVNFKLAFKIRKQPNDGPVFHKQDGQRFLQTNTVKLNANSNYSLTFNMRPRLEIKSVLVNGERYGCSSVQNEKKDDEYSCTYQVEEYSTTGIPKSEAGKRKDIHILVEMERGVNFKTTLQCKIYAENEKEHCCWGQELSLIAYECHVPKEQTAVSITKEKFL